MNTKNLKPFDLEAALKGKPVMLRDGRKAFVRHHETDEMVEDNCRIWGLVMRDGKKATTAKWTPEGRYYPDSTDHGVDIVGMYQEFRVINGFEVPVPEAVAPKVGYYYTVDFTEEEMCVKYTWNSVSVDKALLKKGLIFLSWDDAVATAKAMLGIDPHEKS